MTDKVKGQAMWVDVYVDLSRDDNSGTGTIKDPFGSLQQIELFPKRSTRINILASDVESPQ